MKGTLCEYWGSFPCSITSFRLISKCKCSSKLIVEKLAIAIPLLNDHIYDIPACFSNVLDMLTELRNTEVLKHV